MTLDDFDRTPARPSKHRSRSAARSKARILVTRADWVSWPLVVWTGVTPEIPFAKELDRST